jgi:ferrous iron transport protein A
MTIADLKPGDSAVVSGWTIDDPPGRLLEFGLIPGTPVELVRSAPLGDPLDIKVRGFHLSIRKSEASLVLVTDTVHR